VTLSFSVLYTKYVDLRPIFLLLDNFVVWNNKLHVFPSFFAFPATRLWLKIGTGLHPNLP